MVSNHSERTFERLRYILGGDRPSQTVHLTLSFARITAQSENLNNQRVVSQGRLRRRRSADFFLSVQSRVICIFTYTTISPSSLLRQRPNHYAIRAGRNLPDKEFRYLRTVIVTAAVHRGLSSMLRLR